MGASIKSNTVTTISILSGSIFLVISTALNKQLPIAKSVFFSFGHASSF